MAAGERSYFFMAKWPLRLSNDERVLMMNPGERWAFFMLWNFFVEKRSRQLSNRALAMSYLKTRTQCHGLVVRTMLRKATECTIHGPQPDPFHPELPRTCDAGCGEALLRFDAEGVLHNCALIEAYEKGRRRKAAPQVEHAPVPLPVAGWLRTVDDIGKRLGAVPKTGEAERIGDIVVRFGERRVKGVLKRLANLPGLTLSDVERLCGGNGKPFNGPLFEEDLKHD